MDTSDEVRYVPRGSDWRTYRILGLVVVAPLRLRGNLKGKMMHASISTELHSGLVLHAILVFC